MIDEELYRQAADELNSERRRPHIWARACALADDDHDEARYLYTNLRVEELLSEAERGGGDAAAPDAPEMADDELSLEPVEFEGLPEVGDGRVESVPAGLANRTSPLPGGDAVDDPASPTSTRSRMSFDLEDDATLDLDPEDVLVLQAAGERAAAAGADTPIDAPVPDEAPSGIPDEIPNENEGTGDDLGARGDVPANDAPPPGNAVDGPTGIEMLASVEVADDTDGRDALDALFATGETVQDLADDEAAAASGLPFDELKDEEEASPTPHARVEAALRESEAFANGGAAADERADGDAGIGDGDGNGERVDDSVVRTVDPDEIGIDDTVALDPDRPIPGGESPRVGALDELDWLDEAYRAERQSLAAPARAPLVDDDGDPLTRELRRQAEELPDGGAGAIIAHEPVDALPVRRVGHDGGHERAGEEPAAAVTDDASDIDGPFALTDGPLELTDERGGDTEYAVFMDAAGRRAPQAVRQGNSWGALIATVPWLLHRRLVGTAIVYVLFAIVVLAGLAVTALAWQEAGAAADIVTKGATVGFALLALAGLVVVPFRNANHWREDKLERRGFDLVAYVRTRDRERAVALARESASRRA